MLARIHDALRQGDFASALALSRQLVAAEPANAEAWHLLGIALKATGDGTAAREALDKAIALDPERGHFHATRAALDLSEGKPTDGLQQAVALDPNTLVAYLMQVHAALARDDRPEAERNLRLAQRVDPGHPLVVLAEGHVAQAKGDPDHALRCFTAAANAQPDLASAQLALGIAYLQRQMWVFAEQALANALRLDPARPRIALRGLVEAQRRQEKRTEALATLDELIERFPAEHDAVGLRAELRLQQGQGAAAVEDMGRVLDHQPLHLPSLRRLVQLLGNTPRAPEAIARVEAALAKAPAEIDLWLLRLQLASATGESPLAVLERWLASQPEHPACLDLFADYHFSRGDLAQASAWADRALAKAPRLFRSGMVKLEAERAEDLDQALARAARMLSEASDIEQQRSLLAWTGMALDAAGRHAEAAARWKDMLRRIPRQPRMVPPPSVAAAEQVPEGEISATLVWAPVGVRAEHVLISAKQVLGARLGLERASVASAGDGFGLMRFPPGHPRAGSAERWTAAWASAKLDPATVIDWLPHLDPYTLAALRGARVLALVTDPRQALMNWFVHGSLQNYLPAPDPVASADWLARGLEALADHRDAHPDRVVVAALDGDAGEVGALIEQALGLEQPLPGLRGPGLQLPDGHWRHYRDDFAEAFARLAPVAVRLGYPAD
ncbi:MAG TPA: tetratricopeptide repeat protein [Arenimonas sp.]|uniref:tetratricopeptide repeat protein n=1 Tax=Arenimonas sp. TaxID=1872635 RepID=UPI002D7ECA4E|nr:tetratricopeptide repeat protein [Arenimonas sp.]HEU0154024.1 tetratricopeptide repeat protein [Arenimonas sp.]